MEDKLNIDDVSDAVSGSKETFSLKPDSTEVQMGLEWLGIPNVPNKPVSIESINNKEISIYTDISENFESA